MTPSTTRRPPSAVSATTRPWRTALARPERTPTPSATSNQSGDISVAAAFAINITNTTSLAEILENVTITAVRDGAGQVDFGHGRIGRC